ncbi:Gfo/Idh/MocA family oxidoreductase [Leifsonia sp. NPDC058194]|uniref:Gfo/Idh/MocA family oxidoreductase n=1 Tax=Leifsonia sp. NPDC058194 TaxID=3346374 RepID=UPI0036DE50FC
MNAPIRTAVVGYGFSGRRIHLPLLQTTDGFEVTAIVARSDDARRIAAEEHPGVALATSVEELLSTGPAIDLCVVGTPDDAHVRTATPLLRAGIDVVIDKPLTPTAADGRALYDLAEQTGARLTAFQNKRWDADFLTVRATLESGIIGEPTRYEASIVRWAPEVGQTWREQRRLGTLDGRLADLGSHLVDQAVALLGPVASVYAELDVRRPGARTNDDVFLALTHQQGVRSHLHMGSVTSHPRPTFALQGLAGSIETHGLDGQFAALAHGIVPGTDRWREFDSWTSRVLLGTEPSPAPSYVGDWRTFYRELADAVHASASAPIGRNVVLHVLDILEAARVSHRRGETVRLDPLPRQSSSPILSR